MNLTLLSADIVHRIQGSNESPSNLAHLVQGLIQQEMNRQRDVASHCEDARGLEVERLKGLFATILSFDGHKEFVLDCTVYAHGWAPLLLMDTDGRPIRTMAKLADKWRCTKENVRKLVNKIQTDNDLPKVPGQRDK